MQGEYAYGWLRTETGVHRLVRKSPFDSGNRRHTSFASVFVSPEVDDDIEIEINPADLRIDVYRSSRRRRPARQQDRIGGAHHAPAERHRGRVPERAQPAQEPLDRDEDAEGEALRARSATSATPPRKVLEDSKSDVSWGNQIRSYVLDQSRIKDLRTGVEVGNTAAVLDGDAGPVPGGQAEGGRVSRA